MVTRTAAPGADSKGPAPISYDQAPGLNWSRLKHLATSPLAYRYHCDHEQPDSDAMALGRATHTAILEPVRFLTDYAVWRGGVRRGAEWDAFREASAGREIIREQDTAALGAMQAAVWSHGPAREALAGCKYEDGILWQDNGRACKGRIDAHRHGVLVDLKTTAELARFPSIAARYWYHGQLAWYRRGLRATGRLVEDVAIVAVETKPPHDVALWRVPEAMLAAGDVLIDGLLSRLAECEAANAWPGAYPTMLDLTLPSWAARTDQDNPEIDFGTETIK